MRICLFSLIFIVFLLMSERPTVSQLDAKIDVAAWGHLTPDITSSFDAATTLF
jgi:hypothetical protein